MNESASQMKKEIHIIANYRALIISKHFISLLLLAATLYLGIFRYPISPFYILLFLNILPYILNYAFRDYAGRYHSKLLISITQDIPFRLVHLKEKYKYTRLSYISNSFSYLLALLLLCLWQINYNTTADMVPTIAILPVSILITGLALRLLGVFLYFIKVPYDLSNNRL